MTNRQPRGRPAKPYPKIPDTYENIIKALVKPVKKEGDETEAMTYDVADKHGIQILTDI